MQQCLLLLDEREHLQSLVARVSIHDVEGEAPFALVGREVPRGEVFLEPSHINETCPTDFVEGAPLYPQIVPLIILGVLEVEQTNLWADAVYNRVRGAQRHKDPARCHLEAG